MTHDYKSLSILVLIAVLLLAASQETLAAFIVFLTLVYLFVNNRK
ncbi:MAG: hypothetical protein AABW88_02365 [Nanoarchaeota archaeon]